MSGWSMRLGVLLAVGVLQLAPGRAHACLFLRSVEPAQWYEWSSVLFAGEVTRVEEDRARGIDVIGLRVIEAFKGPEGESAKVEIPSRFWAACKLERPAAGASVLVVMHAGGDVQLVPLTAEHTAQLRPLKGK